jgi:hypothetical protein
LEPTAGPAPALSKAQESITERQCRRNAGSYQSGETEPGCPKLEQDKRKDRQIQSDTQQESTCVPRNVSQQLGIAFCSAIKLHAFLANSDRVRQVISSMLPEQPSLREAPASSVSISSQ